jgi:transposase
MVAPWRCPMDVLYAGCCGLESQNTTGVAWLLAGATGQPPTQAVRTVRALTAALGLGADGLRAAGCTPGAMARTGVSWRPVSALLAGLGPLLVVNAQPLNAVPGRTTAVRAAAGSAARRRHGRLRGRCRPATPQRPLRGLTRHRTPVGQERARGIPRVHAGVAEATLPRAAVVTEIRGVSAPARLEALIAGPREVAAGAALARGRRRARRAHRAEA